MDADQDSPLLALERALWDHTMDPTHLPLSLLRDVTGNFSAGQEIGRGGFGSVYKGDLRNGTMVAVKKLFDVPVIPDEDFQSEVDFLRGVSHKNTVRLLGFCSDTQRILAPLDERTSVWAEVRHRLLCFELLHKGSLANYINDASSGLPWSTRYDIIKGLCEGVHYLHQQQIIHMDLKPQNILLDDLMTPKITDFGLSKRFSQDQSRHITENIFGTLGYMAPELLTGKVITFKSDIFSLGVIVMEMLMGCKGTHNVEQVLETWRNGFGTLESHIQLEQVKVCAEIAIQCMDDDPAKRPTSWKIIQGFFDEEEILNWSARGAQSTSSITQVSSFADKLLNKFKSMSLYRRSFLPKLVNSMKRSGDPSTEVISYGLIDTDLFDVHPLELRFPFEANKPVSCPLSLTNKADQDVFWIILPEFPDLFLCEKNIAGILSPRTTCGVILRMVEQQERPLNTITLYILMIITSKSTDKLFDLFSSFKYRDNDDALNPLKRIEELGGQMHLAMVTAIVCPQSQIITPNILQCDRVAMDAHPTEPWLVITEGEKVFIWNYQTKEVVMSFQSNDNKSWLKKMLVVRNVFWAVKFIPRKQWFVTGDETGNICVYSYLTRTVVKKFSAYSGSAITSLAVHPTYALLISLGFRTDDAIRIWDWDMGWKCVHRISLDYVRVGTLLKFNPKDATTFAGGYHVWSIHSSEPRVIIRNSTAFNLCDYLHTGSPRQYLIIDDQLRNNRGLQVYDLETVSCVHTIVFKNESIHALACHPTLPVMVTGSNDESFNHTICFWNTANYRVMKMVRRAHQITNFAFVGSIRLVINYGHAIEVMEMDLEALARQQ